LAEIVLHGNIYVFPITGSARYLVQLTKRLLEKNNPSES